jgi:hypothetical protein
MLRMFSTLMAIRTSIAANLLIFYIQKLPVMGKLIKNTIYANLELKKIISVAALLLTWIGGFLLPFMYIGLLIYLPVVSIGEDLTKAEQLSQFIHIFTIISFVIAAVSSATILEPKREKYIAVKLMRLSPARYMKTTLAYRYTTFGIYLLPAMLLFAGLLGAAIVEAVMLTVLLALWRIVSEYLHLRLFERTGVVLIKQTAIVWSVILAGYAGAYAPLLLGAAPITDNVLLNLPLYIAIPLGGVFAAFQLARYTGYREAVDVATKRDDPLLNMGRMMADAQKKSVETKQSDYDTVLVGKGRLIKKEGHAYLNELFFMRHRSLIRGPINKRLVIIGAIGVVGVIFMLLFRGQLQEQQWNAGTIIPFLVLTMYFLSVGDSLCKAMFYNCDLSLMRYSFYRSSAYDHFRIRLGVMVKNNLLIAATLGLAITAVTAATGSEWLHLELLMVWACVISLAIFYSVHHLFMYYYLQPYSTELNVKNPLFFAVNLLVSFASGFSIIWRGPSSSFTIVIVGATLLYLIVALMLVRKHGARTFRVK